jgi:hypothetical protein
MATKKEEIKKFQKDIDQLCKEMKLNQIEAVVYYCEKRNIEIESIAAFIKGSLKAKISKVAKNLNMMKRKKKCLK